MDSATTSCKSCASIPCPPRCWGSQYPERKRRRTSYVHASEGHMQRDSKTGSVWSIGVTGNSKRYVESAAAWAQFMPREGIPAYAGMTWECAGMAWVRAGTECSRTSRERSCLARGRARVFVVVRRTLLHCVDFRRRREGCCPSGVGRSGVDSRLRGNDVGGCGNDAGECGHGVSECGHGVSECGHAEGRQARWLGVRMFRAWGCLLGLWFRRGRHSPRVVHEFCSVKFDSVGSIFL